MENGIDELLLRCLDGIADDAEYEKAWHWVHESPENTTYYNQMRDAWFAANLSLPVDHRREEHIWTQLEKQIRPEPASGKTIRMKVLKWAAAAAILVIAYLSGIQTPNPLNTQLHPNKGSYTIEAPKGGKSVMTLSDGSKVWLNAGSILYFDDSFNGQHRTLSLQGEAYFEVAHDKKHPFLVKTSDITIAALGTAFNVKAYPEEDKVETTLVEGSVRIETNASTHNEPVILQPNQKAIYYKSRQTVSIDRNESDKNAKVIPQKINKIEVASQVDVKIFTSWKDKRWMVQGESLGVFATTIERRYDVILIFNDKELKDYKISATLEEETIEQLLNAIRLTVPMNYRIERNKVYLNTNQELKSKYDKLIKN
jgi:ferric-dicitrate binding protein FerR (iron transport regulator)